VPPSNKTSRPASLESRPASIPEAATGLWEANPVDLGRYNASCRTGGHAWFSLAVVQSDAMAREVFVCDECGGRMQYEWRK
jgi:hypothetical protein